MINLYDKKTKELIGHAIKYNGTNKIEYNMFGVTGTEQGRQTKIDCQGKAFIKNGFVYEPVKQNNFVVEHGGNYKQMDIYTLMELYEFDEQEN